MINASTLPASSALLAQYPNSETYLDHIAEIVVSWRNHARNYATADRDVAARRVTFTKGNARVTVEVVNFPHFHALVRDEVTGAAAEFTGAPARAVAAAAVFLIYPTA